MTAAIAIVGASHAGVQLAAALRQGGWQEKISLISAEKDLPYHRPPLSKGFLSGKETADQILLKGEKFYEDQGIDLMLDTPVHSISTCDKTLESSDTAIRFDKAVIATGASARRLSVRGDDLDGVFFLRSLADARELKERLEQARSIAIIGGGFIGLEVAASAREAGKPVCVIEAQDRLLARALPPMLSDWLLHLHTAKGVSFRFSAGIEGIGGGERGVTHVQLRGGEKIDADLVLIGVGSTANVGLAAAAGATLDAGGILVDEGCRTSVPDLYAIGDCAAQHNFHADGVMRVESVQNATDQARALAALLTGRDMPPPGTKWFWTDQYDLKLQIAGLVRSDCASVVRGDLCSNSFSIMQLREGRMVSAFSVNRPADHLASRRLISSGAQLDAAALADPDIPLAKLS